MSKHVKDLITNDFKNRLQGVTDALLVNVIGIDANLNVVLRRQLREKNITLMVIKNSLARRATEGTPLAAAFEGIEGTLALVWGGEDIVSLAKEVDRFAQDKDYEAFCMRGGVMEGKALSAEEAHQLAKWPSRTEQLSLLVGQILSPGATLAGQLLAPGGSLASQIKQKAEDEGSSTESSTES
jgi:large subunit ribosomal protein L10